MMTRSSTLSTRSVLAGTVFIWFFAPRTCRRSIFAIAPRPRVQPDRSTCLRSGRRRGNAGMPRRMRAATLPSGAEASSGPISITFFLQIHLVVALDAAAFYDLSAGHQHVAQLEHMPAQRLLSDEAHQLFARTVVDRAIALLLALLGGSFLDGAQSGETFTGGHFK